MAIAKVSNLPPGPQMDALVAEVLEWEAVMLGGTPVWCSKKGFAHHFGELVRVSDYTPSTNGGQAMELAETFGLVINFEINEVWKNGYSFNLGKRGDYSAICRAVIASKSGEYVEVAE